MTKIIQKVLLGSFLIVSSAMAGESDPYTVDTYSLLGFEGGLSSISFERNTPALSDNYIMPHGGIKVGAQSEDYRVFLSGRYYEEQNFDYMTTIGGELQYMFNFSSAMNFFVGVNYGIANIKFTDSSNVSRTVSDPYYGGDAGFNLHMGNAADIEFGARIMSIDAQNTKSNVTYQFNTNVSAYVSFIFKYKMD